MTIVRRNPFPRISPRQRLRNLAAARLLRRGGLIAHATSTLPGVAALPIDPGVKRLRQFKQRAGPFLLLADSAATALSLARHLTPRLRQAARSFWPGDTTLIYPGRPGLPDACYHRTSIAVRVDADAATRHLARCGGGLLLSSSLNRRGEPWRMPERRLRMRWHRFLDGAMATAAGSGSPSKVVRVGRNGLQRIR